MTETTIEERLADIRADMNYERSSLITVGDVANSMIELVDVVKEINDRSKSTNVENLQAYNDRLNDRLMVKAIEFDTDRTRLQVRIKELEEKFVWCGTEMKNMHAGSKSAEKWIDTLEERNDDLTTELDVAMQIRHDLKSQIVELRNNYVCQSKKRWNRIDVLEAQLKASKERNEIQAYVIRNRVNSFGEGVFAKALEDDVVDMKADIEGLDAELAGRRDEAKVLWKVVKIAKDWNDIPAPMSSYPISMRNIYNIVKEYIDILENVPDITIQQTVDKTVTSR